MDKLAAKSPQREIIVSNWEHIRGLDLADPGFKLPQYVDSVLGGDVYSELIMPGLKTGPPGTPVAQQTRLGWVLTGRAVPRILKSGEVSGFQVQVFYAGEEPSISQSLSKLWEIEKIPAKSFLTEEEAVCERHFLENFSRMEDGRYMVRLCFREAPNFPGSRDIALRQWYRTEARLFRDLDLKKAYDTFMQEYLDLRHMELVPQQEIDAAKVYYVPHHAVFRNNKIRVVFNASMPCYSGLSLNDTLHTGGKLQQDIVLVILRWRFFKYVFTTDIVKMFRQIALHPQDRDYLRIFYKFENEIQHFRLCTVTYGTASAPYQSLRVLQQIVVDLCSNDSELKDLFLKQSYVDDFFAGADSIDSLVSLRNRLIKVLSLCGIKLGKWSANNRESLDDMLEVIQDQKAVEVSDVVSALGLKWSPLLDEFSFTVDYFANSSSNVTKRKVLSDSSKLFDPLGWLSPTLVRFKMFLQELWIHGLDWDEPLSGELLQNWIQLREHVLELSSIKIPRWFGGSFESRWSLHGFADASKRAYAACVYFVPETGSPFLICSKVRVAPVKTLSIPKLELLGAYTLAKLMEWVLTCFPTLPVDMHCWSDSRNVLCLLKIIPARLKVFEANKVSEIITILPDVRWQYVPTTDNPADCATRGLSASALREFSLWWSGPTWLQEINSWPKDIFDPETSCLQVDCFLSDAENTESIPWYHTISSFCRLVRVTAVCRRWLKVVKVMRFKNERVVEFAELSFERYNSVLTAQELRVAQKKLILLDQLRYFSREIDWLGKGKVYKIKSSLLKLKPFLDSNGVLRVGGRLAHNTFLSFNEKHPIILDKTSHLSHSLVIQTHRFLLHGGPQLVLSSLFRKYWIIHGKRLVTTLLTACPKCRRYSGRFVSQQMADLPEMRQGPDFPFNCTGVDYAGPIKVTHTKGRGITSSKGYIAIFVCFATKAVHVEIVSALTSEAFLAAFERFTSRRNLPSSIFSDNGTTFQGADAEIRRLFLESSPVMNHIREHVEDLGITWSFIPPHAPHFGGLWEAAVRSFKYHFKRVVGEAIYTYEELSTLASQIEACLNSRPLCSISVDCRDPVPLTPAHFLVGRTLKTLPPVLDISDLNVSYKSRWTSLLAMRNNFWKQWRKEVFHQLIQRNKWFYPHRNLEVGDLVILRDDLASPASWPMAKVIEVHPGRDNLVRVVTLKTEKATLKRPVHKLIYLPVDDRAVDVYHTFIAATCCGTEP